MNFFGVYATMMLYPALFILAVLVLPLPDMIKEPLRALLARVVFFKVKLGPVRVSIFYILFAISLFALYEITSSWRHAEADYHRARIEVGDPRLQLAYKWRAERNFWIALFTTVIYVCVLRINSLLAALHKSTHDKSDGSSSPKTPTPPTSGTKAHPE